MPKYHDAQPFDLIRTIKNMQNDVKSLQVLSAGKVRKDLNQVIAALNVNPYFWGGDGTGWVANNGSMAVASDPPAGAPNPYAALFTISTAGVGAALEQSAAPFPVIPLQQYLVSVQIWTTTTSCTLSIAWQDASHTPISTSSQSIAVGSNTWTRLSTAFLAPVGAAFGYPRVAPADGVGNSIYATAIAAQLSTAAFQPGSNPPVVETWHAVSLPGAGGFSGNIRVKMAPIPNFAILDVAIRWTQTTAGVQSGGSLPSGYYPLVSRQLAMGVGGGQTSDIPVAFIIPVSGAIQVSIAAGSGSGSANWYGGTYLYPLD